MRCGRNSGSGNLTKSRDPGSKGGRGAIVGEGYGGFGLKNVELIGKYGIMRKVSSWLLDAPTRPK